MYYKYWMRWFFTLLLKLTLTVVVIVLSMTLFMGGVNHKNLVPIAIGLAMNVIAIMMIINFVKTVLAPWRGCAEEYFPFYMGALESYGEYKKDIEGGKALKHNKNEAKST